MKDIVYIIQRVSDGHFLCYDGGITCIQEPSSYYTNKFKFADHWPDNPNIWPQEIFIAFNKESHRLIRLQITYEFLDIPEKISATKELEFYSEMDEIYNAEQDVKLAKDKEEYLDKLKKDFLEGL